MRDAPLKDAVTAASALVGMDEAERLLAANPERKTVFDNPVVFLLPISTWVGMAVGHAAVDPSLLTTLPWAPLIWAALPLGALLVAGFVRMFRKERRQEELRARLSRLAPVVVRGIREGSVLNLTDRQGEMLADLVGERTLREALQFSPAFRGTAEA